MFKATALHAVKVSAAVVDRLQRPGRGVIVLLYHRVGAGSGLQVDLPRELFARQMETLAEEGHAVSLDDAISALSSVDSPDRDPAAVTFDDGTADFVDVALPILVRYRIPATLYVATDFIERGLNFPADGKPASWAGLRDALATGLITIGSHTHSHALMDRLAQDKAEYELDRSRSLIQERLGVEATHFAYPKAVRGSSTAEALIRRRFRSAALGGNRANPYGGSDPYRLARSGIQVADGMRWFRRKLDGGMAFEETLRRSLNRIRYARAAT